MELTKQTQKNRRKRKIKSTLKLEGKRKRLSGSDKKEMLGMVIRRDGNGDSGIVVDMVGREGSLSSITVDMSRRLRVEPFKPKPWGKNYNRLV